MTVKAYLIQHIRYSDSHGSCVSSDEVLHQFAFIGGEVQLKELMSDLKKSTEHIDNSWMTWTYSEYDAYCVRGLIPIPDIKDLNYPTEPKPELSPNQLAFLEEIADERWIPTLNVETRTERTSIEARGTDVKHFYRLMKLLVEYELEPFKCEILPGRWVMWIHLEAGS